MQPCKKKSSILLPSVKLVMQTKLAVPQIIVFRGGGGVEITGMVVVFNDI